MLFWGVKIFRRVMRYIIAFCEKSVKHLDGCEMSLDRGIYQSSINIPYIQTNMLTRNVFDGMDLDRG